MSAWAGSAASARATRNTDCRMAIVDNSIPNTQYQLVSFQYYFDQDLGLLARFWEFFPGIWK
jgi:hypothetical protein